MIQCKLAAAVLSAAVFILCGCSSASSVSSVSSDKVVVSEPENVQAVSYAEPSEHIYTAQDLIFLQSFLLDVSVSENLNGRPYDLNEDGKWNISDLCLMKHRILHDVTDTGDTEEKLYLTVNGQKISATFEENSSVDALKEKLSEEDVVINAKEYGGFEKVGSLGFSLPTNDMQYVTDFGDIMLYQGNQITLFYNSNSWSYTKIGHVDNMTQDELKALLGEGDVTITLSLK